ncbi:MAG: hypothetical protein ABSC55_18150 [Syntrophorhabdales bacterium]|jgi:hypothetical protein
MSDNALTPTQIRRNARYLGYPDEGLETEEQEEQEEATREERRELLRRASVRLTKLADTAKAENRNMTALENAEYKWLDGRIKRLLQDIRQQMTAHAEDK